MEDRSQGFSDPQGSAEASRNAKGKGKETDSENSKSITDRLQASGRMALNAVTTSQDWSGQMPGSKVAASSSNNIERFSANIGEASSSHRLRSTGPGESLRGPINPNASSDAFDEFTTSEASLEPESHGLLPRDPSSAAEQELSDGAAVVQLLNAPSDELDMNVFSTGDAVDDDDDLTPQAVEKLREALFGSSGNQYQPRWDNLLNFTPDFLDGPVASFESQLHMGTDDPAEARSIWLNQWDDVLSAYTDQVWGDLGPLAAEARREVEELASKEDIPSRTPETKALDRLRQILGHVRGH
ncbi:Fc.00g070150.m01.CDS01 [Cosmosporella sp. VM-42]